MDLNLIQKIIVFAIPVVLAITVHEAAHGYVARMFGDNTAYNLGRVTLNPIAHVDLVGTIVVPLVLLLLPGSFMFGWAKPVPVNFGALRKPKQDMLWVAAAGPLSNLAMVIIWSIIARIGLALPESSLTMPLLLICTAGVFINTILMVLNLVPLPPLDGGRIAVSLLPNPYARAFARIEPYGFFILIALVASNVLGMVLNPFISGTIRAMQAFTGIPFASLITTLLR